MQIERPYPAIQITCAFTGRGQMPSLREGWTSGGADQIAPDLVDWIRAVALDAMAGWLIDGELLSDTSRLGARIEEAIAARAGVEWRFDDGEGPEAFRLSIDHSRIGRGGASRFLVIVKSGLTEIWVRVGGVQTEPVATVLEHLVASGRWAVWLRWNGEPRRIPAGVALVNLTAVREDARLIARL